MENLRDLYDRIKAKELLLDIDGQHAEQEPNLKLINGLKKDPQCKVIHVLVFGWVEAENKMKKWCDHTTPSELVELYTIGSRITALLAFVGQWKGQPTKDKAQWEKLHAFSEKHRAPLPQVIRRVTGLAIDGGAQAQAAQLPQREEQAEGLAEAAPQADRPRKASSSSSDSSSAEPQPKKRGRPAKADKKPDKKTKKQKKEVWVWVLLSFEVAFILRNGSLAASII